jgi:outer membrane receptor for ferrienterochelin and colicins
MAKKYFLLFIVLAWVPTLSAQIAGQVLDAETDEPLHGAHIRLHNSTSGAYADADGRFSIPIPAGLRWPLVMHVSFVGYQQATLTLPQPQGEVIVRLKPESSRLDEVVVSGTMVEVSKMESPIPVEVYSAGFFKKNPSPTLFESLNMITGVLPQINCSVCNTGDIHINGLEGPYTMVLIDGMPIVSSLSTVYGLHGIPSSLIRRIEVVKGPASTLYGSEAVAGLINVITQDPYVTDPFRLDVSGTSREEWNVDVSAGRRIGGAATIWGLNGFVYDRPHDVNRDGFTDITQQKRLSAFSKWAVGDASLAARYVVEDRWGGQLGWTEAFKGSDQVYGETIFTERAELIGTMPFSVAGHASRVDLSYNRHAQDSWYGTTRYKALQHTAYALWVTTVRQGMHTTLVGLPLRYQWYDDNTPATVAADRTLLPGVFVQNEAALTDRITLLSGLRWDTHPDHGSIWTPRLGVKFSPDARNTFRLSGGSGFRVVNLFTEDHAALTGAREVVIRNALNPERSWNANLNWMRQWNADRHFGTLDLSTFITRFSNQILPDYDTDPTKIIYDNLDGYGVSRGMSLNTDLTVIGGPRFTAGVTWMSVFQRTADRGRETAMFAPEWSGNYGITYKFIDITGRFNGPMRLPVVPGDFRPSVSPWHTILNIQLTHTFRSKMELYGGVKNVLDFMPKHPLFRPDAPFSDEFDAAYNYAPMEGRKGYLGIRLKM